MPIATWRTGMDRGGGEGCGYAASLGQRKRVPTYPQQRQKQQEAACFFKDKGRRLALRSNTPWSRERGPVQRAVVPLNSQNLMAGPRPRARAEKPCYAEA